MTNGWEILKKYDTECSIRPGFYEKSIVYLNKIIAVNPKLSPDFGYFDLTYDDETGALLIIRENELHHLELEFGEGSTDLFYIHRKTYEAKCVENFDEIPDDFKKYLMFFDGNDDFYRRVFSGS